MGFCGQVSLGHAAFVGIGAYGAALLLKAGAPLLIALGLGTAITCFFGLIVGFASIDCGEDFLAITTLAVGFLFLGVVRKSHLLGGEFGLSEIPHSNLGCNRRCDAHRRECSCGHLCRSVYRQQLGGGSRLVRLSLTKTLLDLLGISAPRYKLLAFCTGTAFAGLAGALYVNYSRFVLPDAFQFPLSVTALAMVVVGGIGSTFGVAFGALALVMLPELFANLAIIECSPLALFS